MQRVFAVEDNQGACTRRRATKQSLCELLPIPVVQGSFDVSTVVLILESAIYDNLLVVHTIICTLKEFEQSGSCDARKAARLVGAEMGKIEYGLVDHVRHMRRNPGRVYIIVRHRFHNVALVLALGIFASTKRHRLSDSIGPNLGRMKTNGFSTTTC
jgi:hypothetical protein